MTVPPDEGSHVDTLLGAYVLGALSREEDQLIAGHLQVCDACSAEYLGMAEVTALLGMFSKAELLDGLDGEGEDEF
jgi:anti-sigma factor RsiW